jgi:hypothetical protein
MLPNNAEDFNSRRENMNAAKKKYMLHAVEELT